MAVPLAQLRGTLEAARQECRQANYDGALSRLLASRDIIEVQQKAPIIAEIVSVHILKGDFSSAKQQLQWLKELPNDFASALPRIQRAYVDLMTDCDLETPLATALQTWGQIGNRLSDELSEDELRVAYYCLEIFHLIDEYGNRRHRRRLPLRIGVLLFTATMVVSALITTSSSCPESLRLLEPSGSTKLSELIMADIALSDDVAEFGSRYLYELGVMIQTHNVTVSEADRNLGDITRTSLFKAHYTGEHDVKAFRILHLSPDHSEEDRWENLLEVAQHYMQQGYLLKAQAILVRAIEQGGFEPATSRRSAEITEKLHEVLESVYSRSGDQLGLIEARFQKADLLSQRTQFSSAWLLRGELLRSTLCSKLSGLQRHHLRQAEDLMIFNQGQDAIYHARKYRKFCKRAKRWSAVSLAQNVVLNAMWTSKRAQVGDRLVAGLELAIEADERLLNRMGAREAKYASNTHPNPEPGILDADMQQLMVSFTSLDRTTILGDADEVLVSACEKCCLLAEVRERQGRMDEERNEDMVPELFDILDRGEAFSRQIRGPSHQRERAALEGEIGNLRSAFALFDTEQLQTIQSSSVSTTSVTNISGWYRLLVVAATQDDVTLFDRLASIAWPRVQKQKEDAAKLVKFSLARFQIAFLGLLLYCEDPGVHEIYKRLGFQSLRQGVELCLDLIEETLLLQEELTEEIRAIEGGRYESFRRRQAWVTSSSTAPLLESAIGFCLALGDPELTWKWTQFSKARVLSDELRRLSDPALALAKSGAHFFRATVNDLRWLSSATRKKVVYIDWIEDRSMEKPFVLVALAFERTSEGFLQATYFQKKVQIDIEVVSRRAAPGFKFPESLRRDDGQEKLDELAPLIAPIAEFSDEDDLLILCPTGPLNNFPLHAMHLDGKILLERNPVAYTRSLSALVACVRRLEAPSAGSEMDPQWHATIAGCYEDTEEDAEASKERDEIYKTLGLIADHFGETAITGQLLNLTSFCQPASNSQLVHFHGHGLYDTDEDIGQQSLLFYGDTKLSCAHVIRNLHLRASPLVTVMACDVGFEDVSWGGDESLGIPTAFLLAGASSVIAPLWRVNSACARELTLSLYKFFLLSEHMDREDFGPMVSLAEGLRKCVLELRDTSPYPFSWASFMLYGSWFCWRKPGTW